MRAVNGTEKYLCFVGITAVTFTCSLYCVYSVELWKIVPP